MVSLAALPDPPFATPGQRALVERIAQAAAPEAMLSNIDAAVYLDPERFAAERAGVFGRVALPLIPSAALPDAGTALTHDSYGVPILLTRDRAGVVRAHLNVCSHRGARLVDADTPQPLARITCPYHAWTYGLDGALAAVPRAEVFAGLCRADHALTALPVREVGGIVWVGLDPASPPDFASVTGELADEFDAFALADHLLYAERTHRVAANWKLVVDAFLEPYHVPRLHAASVGPFFADSVSVSDRIGPHFRSAVGRSDYAAARANAPLGALRRAITFSYSVFPNAVVVASPDYMNVMTFHPVTHAETVVRDWMLIPHAPRDADEAAHWQKSWALLDGQVFGAEDFVAAERSQRGLQSGALKQLTIGGLERGLIEFHAELDRTISA
jgi:phenylpropionate dioxygenase-like ring-hydroxylating dioxygenase large terminal subunit